MSLYDPPHGFAIRRKGECAIGEKQCKTTWGGFLACCPGDSQCPDGSSSIPNGVCCPSKNDCTANIKAAPHCANNSWTMYEHDGYFCCPDGQTGFWVDPQGIVGCIVSSHHVSDYISLDPLPQTVSTVTSSLPAPTVPIPTTPQSITSTIFSTSTPSTISSTTFSTSKPTESPNIAHSSAPVGVIVGSVIGGAAGFALLGVAIWYLQRHRRQSKPLPAAQPAQVCGFGPSDKLGRSELDARELPVQLDSDPPIYELPAPAQGANTGQSM